MKREQIRGLERKIGLIGKNFKSLQSVGSNFLNQHREEMSSKGLDQSKNCVEWGCNWFNFHRS